MNSEMEGDVFRNQLKPASRTKRRGLLYSGLCLQRVNARPHTACRTAKQIQDFKLELLHHQQYSPDLATCVHHSCWPLKDSFGWGIALELSHGAFVP
jgi:hypothetical protein